MRQRGMTAWTLVFHILGLVFWIGGLLIETNVLARHTQETSAEVRQALGRLEMRLLRAMADPGAALTLVTGIILIWTNPSYFLHAAWLHAKLALVVVLIGLHAVVRSRTKAFVAGRIELQRRDCMVLHGAISLIFLGILVAVLPGQVFLK
jgi:putative membrane protein